MITGWRANVYLIIALNRLRRSGSVPWPAIIIGIPAYSWVVPWIWRYQGVEYGLLSAVIPYTPTHRKTSETKTLFRHSTEK
jgi:hypothetical protein